MAGRIRPALVSKAYSTMRSRNRLPLVTKTIFSLALAATSGLLSSGCNSLRPTTGMNDYSEERKVTRLERYIPFDKFWVPPTWAVTATIETARGGSLFMKDHPVLGTSMILGSPSMMGYASGVMTAFWPYAEGYELSCGKEQFQFMQYPTGD